MIMDMPPTPTYAHVIQTTIQSPWMMWQQYTEKKTPTHISETTLITLFRVVNAVLLELKQDMVQISQEDAIKSFQEINPMLPTFRKTIFKTHHAKRKETNETQIILFNEFQNLLQTVIDIAEEIEYIAYPERKNPNQAEIDAFWITQAVEEIRKEGKAGEKKLQALAKK